MPGTIKNAEKKLRAEKREVKKRIKMKVDGAGVKRLALLIKRKAKS